jgi:hypothetical protein
MSTQYPKGSEWRRWDLHVHTPCSVLNNGFGSDWDAYVKNLFTILLAKQIAVVGITDYFTIDGYKKLSEEYVANPAKLATLFTSSEIEAIKNILVLPNVEFRSDIFVGPNGQTALIFMSSFRTPFRQRTSRKSFSTKSTSYTRASRRPKTRKESLKKPTWWNWVRS